MALSRLNPRAKRRAFQSGKSSLPEQLTSYFRLMSQARFNEPGLMSQGDSQVLLT